MSRASRIRILRIRRAANLLTAQAYEELFDRQLGTAFDVTVAPLEPWFESVLGPAGAPVDLDAAASRFAALTSRVDFVCPNYQAMPLAPLLLAVRNRARARARLLFIAHASGAYSYEWALMRPLLAAGDIIVAPSESARRTIEHLAPELTPFVHAMPHPMEPLARSHAEHALDGVPLVASIGRIHAEKLTHRQIEAMAILRDRGRTLRMEIAGPLDDGGWNGPHPYTRTLQEQLRRLGLGDSVRFVGAVRGGAAKSDFLSRASVVVNLSTTIEESFPKTPIEALGLGVPVVGTNWNGLRDTVGRFGRLVPVAPVGALGAVDVDATAVADAIASVLDAPPSPDACMAWTRQFTPEMILPRYRAALEAGAAMSESRDAQRSWPDEALCAAPAAGLLSGAAPLTAMSWRELFETYVAWAGSLRRSWIGAAAAMPADGDRVRNTLLKGIEPAVKRFFGNIPEPRANDDGRPVHAVQSVPGVARDVFDQFETAALNPGVLETRTACLGELIAANRLSAAARALDALVNEGLSPAAEAFWRVELALARGDASRALTESLACVRSTVLVASDWPLVRQAARAARRAQAPGAALPALLAWLTRFPDSQESGPVWLDACVNALKTGDISPALLETYLDRARALLGDIPAIQKCARSIAAAQELKQMQEMHVLVG